MKFQKQQQVFLTEAALHTAQITYSSKQDNTSKCR